jgi:DNA-binding CsgD family transcriptional regulator
MLSGTTVKTHVGHVLMKLGVRDRVQAVILAYESGIVAPLAAAPELGQD